MNTWKIILATLVIFAAGVVTGGLLVSYADRVPLPPIANSPPWFRESGRPQTGPGTTARPPVLPGGVPQFLRKEFLERLEREVDLTPEQRQRIEQIIREGQERNRQLWERVSPELRKEIANTRRQIQSVLRPDQRARFDELMKQRPPRRTEEPNAPGRSRPRDQYRSLPGQEGSPREGDPTPLPPP